MNSNQNGGIPTVEYLFGHTSEETAYLHTYYCGGVRTRLRQQIWVWLETDPEGKKGDCLCFKAQHIGHKSWADIEKSNHAAIGVLFKYQGRVGWYYVSHFEVKDRVKLFVEEIGGMDKLTPGQHIMYESIIS